jgi:N-acyl amino acid synthase of PEP-CTERM/exosortase system
MLFKQLFGKRDILVPYFHFRTVLPDVTESSTLNDIYALRFAVYCRECAFLDEKNYEDGLESDRFDEYSTHFAAYADDETIVGTVRLVRPTAATQPYPFEEHLPLHEGFTTIRRADAAEISRLVVRKTYRRRRGDSMYGVTNEFLKEGGATKIEPGTQPREQRGNSPLLLLGIYREMYRYSRANGIRYWYAAMERSLARSLDKMGFKFTAIGPQIDYYGPVTLYMADLNDLNGRLQQENRFLAAWFNDQPIPMWIRIKTLIGTRRMHGGRLRK